MSWLRRLSDSKSTWAALHRAETRPNTFNPMTSNMEQLARARNMTRNLVWRDIYDSLLTCRNNILFRYPSEYLSIPVNGEPFITKNKNPITQSWCEQLMIRDILDHQGDLKESKSYNTLQKPILFELIAIHNAIGEYIDEYKYRCADNFAECIRGIGPCIGIYNIYGRIVHKKAKGCYYFYKILSTHDRKDGWESACNRMESDLTEYDPDYEFDRECFFQ